MRRRLLKVLTFLPSNSCVPCANTLSTLAGSPNVMKPNPLKEKGKRGGKQRLLKIRISRSFEGRLLKLKWNKNVILKTFVYDQFESSVVINESVRIVWDLIV